VADPVPKRAELLVKIHATTVISGDCRMRSFTVPPAFWLAGRQMRGMRRPKNPIFGSEFAGEVVAIASAPGPVHSGFAERAGQRMGAAMAPADVVKPTLDALGRKATVLPGTLLKLLVYSLALLPRQLRVRIMGRVMYGMTKHRFSPAVGASAMSP
jgi:NADPH:quinone reductase-like Zn-dependent oxidoreductase